MKNDTNIRLRQLKMRYIACTGKRLTNKMIAVSLRISVHRVNAWTKYDENKMDHIFIERLETLFQDDRL